MYIFTLIKRIKDFKAARSLAQTFAICKGIASALTFYFFTLRELIDSGAHWNVRTYTWFLYTGIANGIVDGLCIFCPLFVFISIIWVMNYGNQTPAQKQ